MAKKKKTARGPSSHARDLDATRPLYEKQEKETGPAFEAFEIYRLMAPADRSISAVMRETGKGSSIIEKWSAVWSWPLRAHEWDLEGQRRRNEAHLSEVESMSRRQARQARESLEALALPARALLAAIEDDPDLLVRLVENDSGLSTLVGMVVQSARLLPEVAEMERQIRGVDQGPGLERGPSGQEISPGGARALLANPQARKAASDLFRHIHGGDGSGE